MESNISIESDTEIYEKKKEEKAKEEEKRIAYNALLNTIILVGLCLIYIMGNVIAYVIIEPLDGWIGAAIMATIFIFSTIFVWIALINAEEYLPMYVWEDMLFPATMGMMFWSFDFYVWFMILQMPSSFYAQIDEFIKMVTIMFLFIGYVVLTVGVAIWTYYCVKSSTR